MRYPFIAFALLLLGVAGGAFTVGQDAKVDKSQPDTDHASTTNNRSYSIEIIEFQIDASDGADLSADQLVKSFAQMKSDAMLKRADTIRFSAVEQKASVIDIGKLVSLTTGSMPAGQGRPAVRQMRDVEVGTKAEAMLVSSGKGQVSMDLLYRSSRVEGEGTDDSPPNIVSVTIETALVLELGKPKLLGGTSADPNVYVLLKVTE